MSKANKKWFYGIYGIEFVYHGDWSDPEIIWHGKSFDYFDVENPMWEVFSEECEEKLVPVSDREDMFPGWVKSHASLAREYLQNLMDCKCFYGR